MWKIFLQYSHLSSKELYSHTLQVLNMHNGQVRALLVFTPKDPMGPQEGAFSFF